MKILNRYTGAVILEIDTLTGATLTDANLTDANLTGADLTGADLRNATLTYTTLTYANLTGADLTDATLTDADLSYATLSYATLTYATLTGANLTDANLTGANLTGACLTDANLTDANLRNADLTGACLRNSNLTGQSIVPVGSFTAYKKASGKVIELIIPAAAGRNSSLVGRKCRCEYAYVKRILNVDGTVSEITSVRGDYSNLTVYTVGKKVVPDSYNDDMRVECDHGIHFFITFAEAAQYSN